MATIETSLQTPRVARLRRRALRAIGRGLTIALAVVVALGLAGAAYEAIAARGDAVSYPPPGQMVDVGGFRMHLHCVGEGSPTVVFEGGYASPALDWSLVQPLVAGTTRACAYDRAGLGWSERSLAERTPQRIASELHALLHGAGVEGPYVLVGASLGGKYVRRYAHQYPDEVAGVVFADARHESFDAARPSYGQTEARMIPVFSRLFWLWGRVGLARLAGSPFGAHPAMPPATQATIDLLQFASAAIATAEAEYFARGAHDEELRGATLGDRPVIVLAAGKGGMKMEGWDGAQRTMAGLSRNGRLVVLPESGHAVQLDAPGEVAAAIAEVVGAVRGR